MLGHVDNKDEAAFTEPSTALSTLPLTALLIITTTLKGMCYHSSILAWEIPWTDEPGRYSPWDHEETNTTIPDLQVGNEAQRG